jgi:S1-C subfamily serine protease
MALMFAPPGTQRQMYIYTGQAVVNTTAETAIIPFDVAAGDDPTFFDTQWPANSGFRTTVVGTLNISAGADHGQLFVRFGNTIVVNTGVFSIPNNISSLAFTVSAISLLLPTNTTNIAVRSALSISSPAVSYSVESGSDVTFTPNMYGQLEGKYAIGFAISNGSVNNYAITNQALIEWVYQ